MDPQGRPLVRGYRRQRIVPGEAVSNLTVVAWIAGLFITAAALTALGLSIAAIVINNNRATRFRHDHNQLRQAVGFSAHKNATQSVPDSATTIITTWDSSAGEPLYDATNGAFNLTSGLFTAALPGQYTATGHICFVGAPLGTRTASLNTDGTGATAAVVTSIAPFTNTTTSQCLSVSQILDLSVGTSVWLEAFQDSGSPLDVNINSRFSLERVTHKV